MRALLRGGIIAIAALLIGCGNGGSIENGFVPASEAAALDPPLPLLIQEESAEAALAVVREWAGENTPAAETGAEVASTPSAPVGQLTAEQAFAIAFSVSDDVEWALWAVEVMRCESTFYIGAVGLEGEVGLMQIHPVHSDWVDMDRALVSPWYNVAVSWELYSERGQGRGGWVRCG